MGFSNGDDFDKKENEALQRDETRDTPEMSNMEVHHYGVDQGGNIDQFWPIHHPMEPSDEDRPVKCPMPNSSVMNNEDGAGRHEDQHNSESVRKRSELRGAMNKERVGFVIGEPPTQQMRKRHHTQTRNDHIITPLLRMPPLPSLPAQNITVFQMLQQLDGFDS